MPTFRAPLHKVGPVYAVQVPAAVVKELGGAGKTPVTVRYLGEAHASTVTPAREGHGRVFLRADIFRPHGLRVGDDIEVSVTLDNAKRVIVVPADLQRALSFRAAARAGWERSAPSSKRIIIERLDESRTAETRERRIDKLVESLAELAARKRKKK